jgi:hypothetical protein
VLKQTMRPMLAHRPVKRSHFMPPSFEGTVGCLYVDLRDMAYRDNKPNIMVVAQFLGSSDPF